jgi:hypothetical protein
VFQQRGLLSLEVVEPLPPVLQDTELSSGELPGFLEGGELRAQFVEGDGAVGGHVLEAGAPPVGLRQFLLPGLLPSQGVAVQPWVSKETIRRTYWEAQVRTLHGGNRPVKNKQLDLFRFVSSKTTPSILYGRARSRVVKDLVPGRHQVHPNDAYGGDARRFRRDYDRAVRPIAALPLEVAEQRERKRKPRERLRRRAP